MHIFNFPSTVPPNLTLWVGLASGHLVAYGVNLTKKGTSKKIDLLPTSKHFEREGFFL